MGILTSLFLRLVPLLLLILIGKYNRQLQHYDPSYFRIDTQAGDNNLTRDGGGGEEKVNSKSYDTSYNVYNVDRLMVDLLSSSPSPSSTLPSSTLSSLLPSSSTNQKLSSSKIIILAGNMDPILSTNEKNNEYKYSSSFQAAKLLYQTNTLRSIIIGCFNVTLCTNEIVDYDDTTKRPTKKDKRTNLLILPYDARNIQSIQNFAFHVVQYVTTGKMQQHHHQQQEQEQEQEQEQQKLQQVQEVKEVQEVQEEKKVEKEVWSYYKPSNIASQILKVVQTGQIMEKKKEEGREEVQEEKCNNIIINNKNKNKNKNKNNKNYNNKFKKLKKFKKFKKKNNNKNNNNIQNKKNNHPKKIKQNQCGPIHLRILYSYMTPLLLSRRRRLLLLWKKK